MVRKRGHGEGHVEERGDGVFRLRYRVKGVRHSETVNAKTKRDATQKLRDILSAAAKGEHVKKDRITVAQWIDQWLAIGAPGRRQEEVSQRTLERYTDLMNVHVKPVLGHRPLQDLEPTEIDKLYTDLKTKVLPGRKKPISPRTQRHVHVVFGASLATAVRTGKLTINPMAKTAKKPKASDGKPGIALDQDELGKLVAGFKQSSLFPIVALTAQTGMRRNEVLALRWGDLDAQHKTLRVERAWEHTKKDGMVLKAPKTARGKRTIDIGDDLVALLLRERDTHKRIMAGIPDGAEINLTMVKLPTDALIFPAAPQRGQDVDLAKPRDPRNLSKEFRRRARKLGFRDFTFHHLRHTHSTMLLDAGMPVHQVAARIGDDPAILLRIYAKLTKKKNAQMSDAVNALGTLLLGN
jgi:integrase